MRAFVVTAPREGAVVEVPAPRPGADEVVVDVHRVGVCGTDVEFWTGEMAYLHQGRTRYPLRLGHEWCGVVSAVGAGAAETWLGRRVTGDTMIGCGHCVRCRSGRHNVCADRGEIGILGVPGALAEQLLVPVQGLRPLPDGVDDAAGAMVEPGGSAWRAAHAAAVRAGDRMLVLGTGTIGLLTAGIARADGVEVHLLGLPGPGLDFARTLGFGGAWDAANLPRLPWDAVVDASTAATLPALALELVEPARRVVFVGLAGEPSRIDTRTLALKDVTAVGILAGSQGLGPTIELYATGRVDPRPLVATTVGLSAVGDVLDGWRPEQAGPGPKMHIDPRR